MTEYYDKFVSTFYQLVHDINRYDPSNDNIKLLEAFEKLNCGRIVVIFLKIMKKYSTELVNKDSELFNKDIRILPGIDFKSLWPKLNESRKNKIWTYLHILFINAELLLENEEVRNKESDVRTVVDKVVDDINKEDEPVEEVFNPFEGVGVGNSQFSVDDMLASHKDLDDDKVEAPGLGSIAKLTGMDKYIDVDKLKEQFENMNDEDIDDAAASLREALGENANPETQRVLNNMLEKIKSELKKDDVKKGDGISKLWSIAEVVSESMKPDMDNSGVDMRDILTSAQNLATKCKDEDGNDIFNKGTNPFDMINKLVQQPQQGNSDVNPQDYMQQCNQMFSQLGVDPRMMQQMMNNPGMMNQALSQMGMNPQMFNQEPDSSNMNRQQRRAMAKAAKKQNKKPR